MVFRHLTTRAVFSTTGMFTIATEIQGHNAQRLLFELNENIWKLRSHVVMQGVFLHSAIARYEGESS
jgi:hypothetical protein